MFLVFSIFVCKQLHHVFNATYSFSFSWIQYLKLRDWFYEVPTYVLSYSITKKNRQVNFSHFLDLPVWFLRCLKLIELHTFDGCFHHSHHDRMFIGQNQQWKSKRKENIHIFWEQWNRADKIYFISSSLLILFAFIFSTFFFDTRVESFCFCGDCAKRIEWKKIVFFFLLLQAILKTVWSPHRLLEQRMWSGVSKIE